MIGFDDYVNNGDCAVVADELDSYLDEKVIPRMEDFNILNWWKTNANRYPTLAQIARDILAIPITTVASESAFNTSGRVVSPYHNRLHPSTLEALMCCQSWLRAYNSGPHVMDAHWTDRDFFRCAYLLWYYLLTDLVGSLNRSALQRVFGGGGDGGATGAESRDCYLNMYAEKKPDKIDPNEQRLSKWCNCALSNEPLREPCVIDKLGTIFNKEALVHALLSKNLPKQYSYIKGLKDLINVKLSRVPGAEENGDGIRFQCPITGLEFNGKYRFVAMRTCGHVLSTKALKEVKSSSCLVCHEEFGEMDKILINGNEEEISVLRERMEEEKLKVKEKKVKKVKNGEDCVDEDVAVHSLRVSGAKRGAVENKSGEKALAKVDVNGKVGNVNGASGNPAVKRFKAADMAPPNANKQVYASIFTSSKKSDFKETYSCRSLPLGRN
ncbi:Replication termination factor 2 [Citrus sinensis]|nr:Replication termination factor 2 [Citrus sinensis]